MAAGTIPSLLFAAHDRDPSRVVFHWKEGERWAARTWAQSLAEVADLAWALDRHGVKHGTPVAILSETRPEWTATDLATLCLGAITVGVYPSLTAEQVAFQLAHSEAKVLVVENEAQARKIAAVRDRLPALEHVVAIERVPGLPRLEELRPPADPTRTKWLRDRAAEVVPEDVATIIYTSGTTGDPKGALLTHDNFVSVALASRAAMPLRAGDRSLVFLPLAHSLQRFAVYRGFLEDVSGAYAYGIDALPEALAFARPTVLATVPRMLEKIRDRAFATAEARGPRAMRVFRWAMALAAQRAQAMETGRPLPLATRAQLRIADRLVLSKIRERLGGEMRVVVSGGAALDPDVARFFVGLGILVLEGWGLTETSAPATANREGAWRLGTVGKALPGVELRIADDGEILVRGPGLFRGYYKDDAATKDAIVGGWFHTGDVGEIDADGFLRITDRKKEILVTAGGKNIPPVNLEKRLERSPYVSQAVAIGDGRPYLTALLVPDDDALRALGRHRGWPDEPLPDRLARPEVHALYEAAVEDANRDLAKFEQIKKFRVLPTTFTVEGGEITPTLKLKRRVIAKKYADVIEDLYRE